MTVARGGALDASVRTLTGSVRLDGASPAPDRAAWLRFVEHGGAREQAIPLSDDALQTELPPGVWDVWLEPGTDRGDVLHEPIRVARCVEITPRP